MWYHLLKTLEKKISIHPSKKKKCTLAYFYIRCKLYILWNWLVFFCQRVYLCFLWRYWVPSCSTLLPFSHNCGKNRQATQVVNGSEISDLYALCRMFIDTWTEFAMKGSASNESWLLIMTIVMADVIKISNPLSYFL